MPENIEQRVKDIIVKQLSVTPDQLTDRASFQGDLKADSAIRHADQHALALRPGRQNDFPRPLLKSQIYANGIAYHGNPISKGRFGGASGQSHATIDAREWRTCGLRRGEASQGLEGTHRGRHAGPPAGAEGRAR